MKATFAIVKRLLASNKISFIITALVVLCATSSGDVVLSNGNYTWVACRNDAILLCLLRLHKVNALGGKQKGLLFRLPNQLWRFGSRYLSYQYTNPFVD